MDNEIKIRAEDVQSAISKNPELFKQKLVDNKIVSSKEVDDVVEGMLNKIMNCMHLTQFY